MSVQVDQKLQRNLSVSFSLTIGDISQYLQMSKMVVSGFTPRARVASVDITSSRAYLDKTHSQNPPKLELPPLVLHASSTVNLMTWKALLLSQAESQSLSPLSSEMPLLTAF